MSTPELPAVRDADAGSGCRGDALSTVRSSSTASTASTASTDAAGSDGAAFTAGPSNASPTTAAGTAAGRVPGEVPPVAPQRFVVSAPVSVLTRLLAGMAADPAVDVLAVSGPADRPRRAVVRMSDRLAAALSAGPDPVVVEPDAELAPPAPSAPPAPPAPPPRPAPFTHTDEPQEAPS